MKRNNKKGFTIVELVIVIAVIAILSAVLIPTFSGIVEKANESARDQEAANIMKEYLIDHDYKTMDLTAVDGYIVVDGYLYTVEDANVKNIESVQTKGEVPAPANGVCYDEVNGVHIKGVHSVPENSTCAHCGAAQ